jgi:hypothetical protein
MIKPYNMCATITQCERSGTVLAIEDASLATVNPRDHTTVVKAGLEHDLDGSLALQALDPAKQFVVGPQLLGLARLIVHGQEIGHAQNAGRGFERGLEDIRVLHVAPRCRRRTSRPN